ncbi:unnamed protein product [Withania somnifera]
MTEEEWLKAAIMDDTVVAELLLRLNKVNPSPSKCKKTTGLPLEWTVRQRRSRPVSVNAKKQAPRASPTTPLSWSGATSVSCGGSGGAMDGGYEESSGSPPLKTPCTTRSKFNATSDATTSKRSRKKKTLAELKEEEILLIKERKQLKKELALAHANLEKQRDTNQNLKRMKTQQANERGTTVAYDGSSGLYQQEVLPSNSSIPISLDKVANKVAALPSSLEEQQHVTALESKFILPDLNLPFGEDWH